MANIFDDIRYKERGTFVYKMFIGGKWVKSKNKELIDVRNPFDASLTARVQSATASEAASVVDAAYKARSTMANMASADRAEILERVAELVSENKKALLDAVIREAGKPVKVAEGEHKATVERFKFAAEEAKSIRGDALKGDIAPWHRERIGFVMKVPLGVILAITPFNYPLYIPTSKIAPAIAAGNTLVVKPASDDPTAMLLLARILQKAGVPDGALNVVTGSGSEIGDPLLESKKVSMVSFTGSTSVGKHIANKAGMKKLHLELGGKSPGLVFDDANLDVATKHCVTGALKFSGQRCDAISRILVMENVADEFVRKVVKEVKKWKVGNPKEKDTLIGPLINERAVEKVSELVEDAKKKGSKGAYGWQGLEGIILCPNHFGQCYNQNEDCLGRNLWSSGYNN